MKAAMLSVFAPAIAIGAGVLLVQLLISLLPGAQRLSVLNVSLDTYFAVLILAALCLWAGAMIRRSAPARWITVTSFLFPALWLFFFSLDSVYPPNSGISALRIVNTLLSLAPLLGMGLSYALPSNQRLERP
jgi:hypothetical protein